MPVTLNFIENDHILLFEFTDPWDINELTSLYPDANAHIQSANFKVHSLVDLSRSRQSIPPQALRARGKSNFMTPNRGYIVMVGAHGLAKNLAEVIFKMVNFNQVKFIDDRDTALAFLLQSIDSEQET